MEVSIIGGGITGLTTALALHKVGIHSTVFERAEQLNEIGAGVWLQPNAIQVLKWLGLYESIEQEGWVLNKMEITNKDLTPIKKIKSSVVSDKYGNQTIAIHRGKLQNILYKAFSEVGLVELGANYLTHSTTKNKTLVQFETKEVFTDVVIGADGIKSKVRTAIGLPSAFRHSNQICCRGIAHIQLPDIFRNEGKEAWGRKMRFGFSQLSESTVYFFAVMNKEICPKELTVESLLTSFKDFNPLVSEIIKATEHLHVGELSDLKRLNTWHKDNTCLLGDAAHATTPNMGQGACQGIEDAYYLSNLLKSSSRSIESTFALFESQRRKKVDYVVNNSWRFGNMAHGVLGQALLKSIMKLTPEQVMSSQMNKLYEVEPIKQLLAN